MNFKHFIYLSLMNNVTTVSAKVPLSKKIAFALGQTGWSLAVFGFTELIYFFYLPPDNGKPLFKAFVYQGSVFKIFTIVGLLSAIGYIISASYGANRWQFKRQKHL